MFYVHTYIHVLLQSKERSSSRGGGGGRRRRRKSPQPAKEASPPAQDEAGCLKCHKDVDYEQVCNGKRDTYVRGQMWLFVWIYGIVSLSLSLSRCCFVMSVITSATPIASTLVSGPSLRANGSVPCAVKYVHMYTHTHATTPPLHSTPKKSL